MEKKLYNKEIKENIGGQCTVDCYNVLTVILLHTNRKKDFIYIYMVYTILYIFPFVVRITKTMWCETKYRIDGCSADRYNNAWIWFVVSIKPLNVSLFKDAVVFII